MKEDIDSLLSAINELLLYIGVDLIHFNELLVKLFATAVVMVYNFITRKILPLLRFICENPELDIKTTQENFLSLYGLNFAIYITFRKIPFC